MKHTGWHNHIRTLTDPRYRAFTNADLPCDHDDMPVDNTYVNNDNIYLDPERYSLPVEPEGDLFGDYANFDNDMMGD